jgi:hypothetical protein
MSISSKVPEVPIPTAQSRRETGLPWAAQAWCKAARVDSQLVKSPDTVTTLTDIFFSDGMHFSIWKRMWKTIEWERWEKKVRTLHGGHLDAIVLLTKCISEPKKRETWINPGRGLNEKKRNCMLHVVLFMGAFSDSRRAFCRTEGVAWQWGKEETRYTLSGGQACAGVGNLAALLLLDKADGRCGVHWATSS